MAADDLSDLSASSFAILAGERAGVLALTDSFDRMPLAGRGDLGRYDAGNALRSVGFEVGEILEGAVGRDGHPLFVRVVPPEGWTIAFDPGSGDAMVRDAQDRDRARITYKASHHDRHAFVEFLGRYHLRAIHGAMPDGSGREAETWAVMDRETGEPAFEAQTLPGFGTVDGPEAEALPSRWLAERERCRDWIARNAPDTSPAAYWTDEPSPSPSP